MKPVSFILWSLRKFVEKSRSKKRYHVKNDPVERVALYIKTKRWKFYIPIIFIALLNNSGLLEIYSMAVADKFLEVTS